MHALDASVAQVAAVAESSFHAIVALWKGASGAHLTAHVDVVRFERWLNPESERPPALKVRALTVTLNPNAHPHPSPSPFTLTLRSPSAHPKP